MCVVTGAFTHQSCSVQAEKVTPERLIEKSPFAYHMAERDSWPGIQLNGLRSTTSLLDLYKVAGPEREALEQSRRPKSMKISHPSLPTAVIRDNGPISDARLQRALTDGTSTAAWYRLLNGKVFFWASLQRLTRFLLVSDYRGRAHMVIKVRTADLISRCADRIWLTRMNTGTTRPYAHSRGLHTFMSIEDFPARSKVVEIAVDDMVEDIAAITESVTVWREDRQLETIWSGSGISPKPLARDRR